MVAVCTIAAIKFTSHATADVGSPNDQPLPGLMLAKLASSQTIVAGLVSKDFDQIRRGAQDMVRICDASQWETNADEVYAHHRKELRRQALKLTELAGEGNLEGAAFVYTHTVSTCINCHQHCRDVLRIADQRRPRNGVIQIPTSDEHIAWPTAEGMRR
jgi:hypothetical protein